KALRIARRERRHRTLAVDLAEGSDRRALLVADRFVRADRRRHRARAGSGDELRDEADAPHVGVAIFFREAQALREMRADLVAAEHLDVHAARAELGGEHGGERALSRAGEAGEPDDEAARRQSTTSNVERTNAPAAASQMKRPCSSSSPFLMLV